MSKFSITSNVFYIAGAGALAYVLDASFNFSQNHYVLGFLDIKEPERPAIKTVLNVFSSEKIIEKNKIVLGVFKPEYRKNFVDIIGEDNFLSVADGNISPYAYQGKGSVVMHGAYLMYNAIIKDFTHVHTGSIVGHDVVIDDYTVLGPGCIIGGGTRIGKGCILGMGTRVLPGIKIGDNVSIGAGAVVTKDILKDDITVVGCPAKEK
jgi:UDP-perosamine 4-acetyltransferase